MGVESKWQLPQSIRLRLLSGFSVILLLNCLSAAIGYASLQRLTHTSQDTLDTAAQVRELSLELKTDFLEARQQEEMFLNTWRDQAFKSRAQQFIDGNQQALEQSLLRLQQLKALEDDGAIAQELASLDSLFENYRSAFAATVSRVQTLGIAYDLEQAMVESFEVLRADIQRLDDTEMKVLAWQILASERAYFNTGNPQYVSELRLSIDQLEAKTAAVDDRALAREMDQALQMYLQSFNAIATLDQQVRVNSLISANITDEISRITQMIDEKSHAHSLDARQDFEKTANQSMIALGATTAIALVLAVIASILLARRIITPLTQLSTAAHAIAQGNFTQTLHIDKQDDEFSQVAAAFNMMVERVRQTLDELELRVSHRTQELSQMNDTLQEKTQFLEETLKQLRTSEENYRHLINHLHAGVVVHGADTRILMNNQTAGDLLGLSVDEITGKYAVDPAWRLLDEAGDRLPLQDYPVNQVIATQRPIQNYILGIQHGGTISPERTEEENQSLSKNVWVLVNAFPVFDSQDQLVQVIVTFIDITDRKLAEEQLRHRAMHDALTGLPNRSLFVEHLTYAIQRAKRHPDSLFAVLFIDLDRFKVINDSLGHAYGDRLLVHISAILKQYIRSTDIVARLGGDEFVILLDQIKTPKEAIRVAERIQSDIKNPVNLSGKTIFTSASIGIAFSTTGYDSPDDILRDADNAMYSAKAQGRSCYDIFDQEMHASAVRVLELETNLRHALQNQEFQLHYQPIFELSSKRLLGFEALVRWHHPTHGVISPGEFIPLAEETGLIIPLSEWVSYEACRQMEEWRTIHPHATQLRISINIAAAQFQRPDFLQTLDSILVRTQLPPSNLKLEVTESLLLEDVDTVLTILKQLHDRHIEISIDDFGTGYSSLSYLSQFPIDTLKIDKAFTQGLGTRPEDESIVEAIVQLAHSLDMNVIAEGVETEFQLMKLQLLHCEAVQGYLFSPPVNADQATMLITALNEAMK